jgi:hypothetical protein
MSLNATSRRLLATVDARDLSLAGDFVYKLRKPVRWRLRCACTVCLKAACCRCRSTAEWQTPI